MNPRPKMRRTIASVTVITLFYLDVIIGLFGGHFAFSPDLFLRLIPAALVIGAIHLISESNDLPKAVVSRTVKTAVEAGVETAVETAWSRENVTAVTPILVTTDGYAVMAKPIVQSTPLNVVEAEAETLDLSELCEDPEPMRQFHAVDVKVANQKASEKGLIILFQELDKCDLYGRKRVYWALRPEFAAKLLKCSSDLKSAAEFTAEEKEVLKSMVTKRWIKLMRNGNETYYYDLDMRTAATIGRQFEA
jgi:hypothetical protein